MLVSNHDPNRIDGLHLVRKDPGSLVTEQIQSSEVLYIHGSNYTIPNFNQSCCHVLV